MPRQHCRYGMDRRPEMGAIAVPGVNFLSPIVGACHFLKAVAAYLP